MKNNFHIASIAFGLFLIGALNVYAQEEHRLCVCFEPDNDTIDLSFSIDSSIVAFNIVLEGFETEEQRQQAWKKYRQGPPTEERYPVFYNVYVTNRKPEKVTSLEKLDKCSVLISVDEFRSENFKYPPGMRGSRIAFIQKKSDGLFLKWNATFFE